MICLVNLPSVEESEPKADPADLANPLISIVDGNNPAALFAIVSKFCGTPTSNGLNDFVIVSNAALSAPSGPLNAVASIPPDVACAALAAKLPDAIALEIPSATPEVPAAGRDTCEAIPLTASIVLLIPEVAPAITTPAIATGLSLPVMTDALVSAVCAC